jgi:hypothetical protein
MCQNVADMMIVWISHRPRQDQGDGNQVVHYLFLLNAAGLYMAGDTCIHHEDSGTSYRCLRDCSGLLASATGGDRSSARSRQVRRDYAGCS